MRKKILNKKEVLERLNQGEEIHWSRWGTEFHSWFESGEKNAIRYDTLVKLLKEGMITHFGFPQQHGVIRLK